MSKKSIEQIRAELDSLNEQMRKKQHVSDKIIIARNMHSDFMKTQVAGANNPMYGTDPWNKGLTYNTGPNSLKAHPNNKFGKGNIGKVQDEEWKRKRLEKIKGPHMIATCPHCKKEGGERIMKRWHFDNCKMKN